MYYIYCQLVEIFLQDLNMYEYVVLRRERSQDFGVVVDLWSLGVIIYYIVIGYLLFQFYGGRKNIEIM